MNKELKEALENIKKTYKTFVFNNDGKAMKIYVKKILNLSNLPLNAKKS